MKVTTFKYTDAKGETTNRRIAVLGEPIQLMSGLDITELGEDIAESFKRDFHAMCNASLEARASLVAKYGLTKGFRQFKPERMEDAVTEYLA